MALKALRKQNIDDRVLNTLQEATAEVTDQFVKNPLLDGAHLTGITVASGDNTINHTLDRRLIGWIVRSKSPRCRPSSEEVFWVSKPSYLGVS
jgi:hypothetical protein